MTDKEAMKLALEALETLMIERGSIYEKAIDALKERLAQPEQEPVAWISPSGALYRTRYHAVANAEQSLTPLYTTPPKRTEPVGDDIASILACRDMLDAQPVPEFDRVIWPERTEQEPLAFAGLSITEIRLPTGMTSRFEGGVLIVEAKLKENT
jgi:hypothetical protein